MPSEGDPLRERLLGLLTRAAARTMGIPELAGLQAEVRRAREALDQPMRVAVVGMIKAGKSTLMNALLGEEVAAVGAVEATFNVNQITWGPERALEIQYKDGRPPRPQSFEERARWTRRAEENMAELLEIRCLKIFHPNPLLQVFDLIDTPGLCSHFGQDSENTEAFLRLHGDELTRVTQEEASGADAVLYLFSHGVSQADQEALDRFLGGLGGASPINAIGVLTKVDTYWPTAEPLEAAATLVERHFRSQSIRSLFYAVKPVLGHLALGARTLTETDVRTLRALAALPDDRFEKLVLNLERLRERDYPNEPAIPPVAERCGVTDRLGQYGVWLACKLLRAEALERDALSEALLRHSGLRDVHDLIVSHFGNRAALIKMGKCMRDLEAACFRARDRGPEAAKVVDEISGDCEALQTQEHAFAELRVLRDFYAGRLRGLTEAEARQMQAVTGEFGRSAAARLELPAEPGFPELEEAALARVRAWSRRVHDPLGGSSATIAAAGVMLRSFERLLHQIREARAAEDPQQPER